MNRITLIIRLTSGSMRAEEQVIERTWRFKNSEGRNMIHRQDGPAIFDSFPDGRVVKRFFQYGNEIFKGKE